MTKCIKRIRDFFEYALCKFTLYLLTYLLSALPYGKDCVCVCVCMQPPSSPPLDRRQQASKSLGKKTSGTATAPKLSVKPLTEPRAASKADIKKGIFFMCDN